jgi:16S rRNA (cytosine967-C5)-methyltransferase
LNAALSASDLAPRDKNLASKLSYEYLRLKGRLDYIVRSLLARKSKKLPTPFLLALGLCTYEILHLDRVPPYASVSWYVEYVKRHVSSRLTGMANGVLREVVRLGEGPLRPDFYRSRNTSTTAFWSRYYSCPQWIVRMWREAYGDAACLRMLQAGLQEPAVGLRVNRTLPEGAELEEALDGHPRRIQRCGPGIAFRGTPEVNVPEMEALGEVSRQSVAVLETLMALEPGEWERPVWDACAGHGGKTCALAELGCTPLWASDLDHARAADCRRELSRLHLPEGAIFVADASRRAPLRRGPGTVLLDVPCSGLGVLARRPDLKWKRKPGDIRPLRILQGHMLEAAGRCLSPGGGIAYLTCTMNPEENEDRIRAYLRGNSGVALERQWDTPAESPLGEFFYGALLRRKKPGPT